MMRNRKNDSKFKKNAMTEIMIIFGFFFIILGCSLLCATVRHQSFVRIIVPFCVLLSGMFSFCVYFFLRKKLMFLGFAIAVVMSGVVQLFSIARLLPYSYAQIWPLYLVFVAISLFVCGFMHFGRPHPACSIPALILLLLGSVFFLFSTDIISMSLRSFVALWWPAFFVLGGLFVILLFFEMRRMSE